MSIYSKEFKEEAIRLSDEIGNKKTAAQLGIPYYTLADWRNKSKHKPKEKCVLSEEELYGYVTVSLNAKMPSYARPTIF